MQAFPPNSHPHPPELLDFRSSPEPTVGVELELQILDPATGELSPGALRILDACADEGIEGVDGEFLLSMIEIKTGICRNVAEVRDQFHPLLRRLRNLSIAMGYDLALGGTHPFSRATQSAISPGERYERIRKRQGWLAYHEAIFGLHMHLGVPDGERAIGLMNLLVPYLPHLLALSANSPFWQGVDTEFMSARAILFRPSAHAGIPQYVPDFASFCRYYGVLHESGAFEAVKDLYWDLRPRPDLGTVEFRICDAPATLSSLLAITALVRSLLIWGLDRLKHDPELARGNPATHWLAAENKSLAARYGLRAACVLHPGAARRTLAEDLEQLLEELMPIAEATGDAPFLQTLRPVDHFESSAERQRRLHRQTGDWGLVLDDMKHRWLAELDAFTADEAIDPLLAAA
jgi:carboxylate-amine ligase